MKNVSFVSNLFWREESRLLCVRTGHIKKRVTYPRVLSYFYFILAKKQEPVTNFPKMNSHFIPIGTVLDGQILTTRKEHAPQCD